MDIHKVLAVTPVSDIESAVRWYERLFGRSPDARPMPSLADWHVNESAWVQVHLEPDRAGAGSFNLTVDDMDTTVAVLAARGITVGEIMTTDKNAKLGPVTDPDGNAITVIENPSR